MKKKSTVTTLAILLLITVVVASIVAGTYARYATTKTGSATAVAAKWQFDGGTSTDGTSTTNETINLYSTITNAATEYPNLKANTIAPGTSGRFQVIVDGTGSEVGYDYDVTIQGHDGQTLPTGLTISAAPEGDPLTGTVPYSTTVGAMKKTITVNWDWAIGDDEEEATGLDNTYQGTTYNIDVIIKGTQHIGSII